MAEARLRRLPSADWLAFGIGVAGMAASYLRPPLLGITLLAVITPSVLRETGLLRDADEFTRGVMHRAGFHALAVVIGLVAANYMLMATGLYDPRSHTSAGMITHPFPDETIRKALVWVFLISYLIQYWGARRGVAWVLVGVAVMTLAPLAALLRPGFYPWPGLLAAITGGTAAAMAGLAWFVRRRPRIAGWVLLTLFAAALVFALRQTTDPRVGWTMLSVIFQVALVFGVTGVALLKAPDEEEAER